MGTTKKKVKITRAIFIEGKRVAIGTVVELDAKDANYLIASNKAEEVVEQKK